MDQRESSDTMKPSQRNKTTTNKKGSKFDLNAPGQVGGSPPPHDTQRLASIPSMTSIQYMNNNEPYIETNHEYTPNHPNKSESLKLP